MADTIQVRAGNKANMPTLADRELAYVRDEEALYVGTPDGNVKIGAALEASVKALEGRKAAAVADVASNAELAAVIGKVNELIAALKASGIMSN